MRAGAPAELAAARASGETVLKYGGTNMVFDEDPSCHTRKDGGRIPNAFSFGLTVRFFLSSFVAGTSIEEAARRLLIRG